jgi:putative ABC transport system ATP-binding protein
MRFSWSPGVKSTERRISTVIGNGIEGGWLRPCRNSSKLAKPEDDGPASRGVDQPVVEARQVTRVYGSGDASQAALRGVDFVAREGEMVAIMGASGCGKTTLLNCLSGLDRPTAGTIALGGRDITSMKEPALTRHRARTAGFVFQSYNLIPVLTAEENVVLPLLTRGDSDRVARETARATLAGLGLAGKEGRLPNELSGGEQQRVAIARALAPAPRVVFADEPTGNLDAERAEDVLNLLVQANRDRHQTLVVVTHDPRVASRCSRVVRMESGLVVS